MMTTPCTVGQDEQRKGTLLLWPSGCSPYLHTKTLFGQDLSQLILWDVSRIAKYRVITVHNAQVVFLSRFLLTCSLNKRVLLLKSDRIVQLNL